VLYTSNPTAGEAIGTETLMPVRDTLGISIPLLVDLTSSMAELSGKEPSVLTETCAETLSDIASRIANRRSCGFMVLVKLLNC
jgi:hypothetical protein